MRALWTEEEASFDGEHVSFLGHTSNFEWTVGSLCTPGALSANGQLDRDLDTDVDRGASDLEHQSCIDGLGDDLDAGRAAKAANSSVVEDTNHLVRPLSHAHHAIRSTRYLDHALHHTHCS